MTVLWLIGAALACPVCGASNDQSTYLAMTIIMSLLPLAFIGSVAWWVARQAASAGGGSP